MTLGAADYTYALPPPASSDMVRQRTEAPLQRPSLSWSPDSARIATFGPGPPGAGDAP